MSPKTIIAIDPGSSGSLAVFQAGKIIAIHDMPKMADCEYCRSGVCAQKHLKKALTEIDSSKIHQIISRYATPDLTVVVEKVWGIKGDTPKTAFRLGQAFQTILTVCQVLDVRLVQVAAITWKSALGLRKVSKEETTAYASEIFCDVEFYTPRGRCLDGRGDAALIGYYAIHNL